MNLPDSVFTGAETILDIGGWFKPETRATHVIDLMPWETRGAAFNPEPLPGEHFNKATWFQADFLKADFKLPFADKSFDLVICGHTVEDLSNSQKLLDEMQRVGKRGAIECPSRLTEQTLGIRDRQSALPGHPHHHWIVESIDGVLWLYSKEDSDLTAPARVIPLDYTAGVTAASPDAHLMLHLWSERIDYRIIRGAECARRAGAFVASLNIPSGLRLKDSAARLGRRLRSRLRGAAAEDTSWWPRIVERSRPYSSIELP